MHAVRFVLLSAIAVALALGGATARADLRGHGGMVRGVAISPDGTRVLTASFDYSAKLWDFGGQTEIGELVGHQGPVNAVAFLPDGKRAISVADDGVAIVWDLNSLQPLARLEGHTHKVMALAVSRDGRLAATGGWDRTVRLWDIESGRQIRVIAHPTPVNAVAFAGDETLVSGGHDGVLRAWRLADGRPRGQAKAHGMAITALAVSRDGRRLLSAGIDAKLALWDVASLGEVRVLEGHDGPVYGVAFAPAGGRALSAGRDGQVIIWNLETGGAIRFIRAHERIAWAVALSPDGRFAVSASSDESARVWHLETGDRIGIPAEGEADPKPWLASTHPGAKHFRKCASCHSLLANGARRSGPHFAGLFGRRAGSVAGYNYSAALDKAEFAWTEETLHKLFDLGPDVFLPGTKMPLQRIPNEAELAELIDYLREVTRADAGTRRN